MSKSTVTLRNESQELELVFTYHYTRLYSSTFKNDCDEKASKVGLNAIWVRCASCDCLPAEYLKRFEISKLPEEGISFIKEGENFCLTIDNWNWYGDGNVSIRNLTCEYGENKHLTLSIPSTLQIGGVKKALWKKVIHTLYKESYNHYILFFDNAKLDDFNDLEECNLIDKSIITLKLPFQIAEKESSHLEKGRENYLSIELFKSFYCSIDKTQNLICKIFLANGEYGTGFLIGHHVIMTNAHVIGNKDACKGAKARFFYHESTTKGIEVDLKELVCLSSNADLPHSDALDYVIIRFEKGWMWPWNALTLYRLSSVAKRFFDSAPTKGEDPIEAYNQAKKNRANIIQHPDGTPKKVAFRENWVKDKTQFLLHYESDTAGGSSGSPVLTDQGEWIGLHHSECIKLENALAKHLDLLLDTLKLSVHERDQSKYYEFNEDPTLIIDIEGRSKGQWMRKGDSQKKSLLKLISEKLQIQDHYALRRWVWEFLKEKNLNPKIEEFHIYCNTAIPSERIRDDLNKNEGKKAKQLKKAEELRLDDCKPLVLPLAFVALLVVGLTGFYLKGRTQ